MRKAMARVFPDPAPASTSKGPSGAVTASRWLGLRSPRKSVSLGEVPVLFNGYRFGQIPRLVDIATTTDGDVIGQELKRYDGYQRRDRLRMLRAVRFAARLEFNIDPPTFDAIREMAPAIHSTGI